MQRQSSSLDGLIILNKPVGVTSAKALYRVRKMTGQRKSGHSGTLDPAASGVLPLCLGRATKLVEKIMDQPKVYVARARLDVVSASHDLDEPAEPVHVARIPSAREVESALRRFVGSVEQVPPRFSAVKIQGKPAYKRVRNHEAIELKARTVRVDGIQMQAYAWPDVEFEVGCGRGFYVRALIRDLGRTLGTGGCLSALARTRVGPFRREDAWNFKALESAEGPSRYLIPFDEALALLEGA